MRRLEEFGARYIAERLEHYLQEEEFAELVAESAHRIKERQETDTIELVDDIRYYLDQRFRLRMEDVGGEEMYDENPETAEEVKEKLDEIVNVTNGAEPKEEAEKAAEPTSAETRAQVGEEEEADFFGDEARMYEDLLGRIDILLGMYPISLAMERSRNLRFG